MKSQAIIELENKYNQWRKVQFPGCEPFEFHDTTPRALKNCIIRWFQLRNGDYVTTECMLTWKNGKVFFLRKELCPTNLCAAMARNETILCIDCEPYTDENDTILKVESFGAEYLQVNTFEQFIKEIKKYI